LSRYEPARYLPLLLAPLVLFAGLTGSGQEGAGNVPLTRVEDEGVFQISLAGRPVGSESFRIHASAEGFEAQAEIRLRIDQGGKTVAIQSFPDLALDPHLRPLTYRWSQKGSQVSRLEVDFRGQLAKAVYQTISGAEDKRDFQLTPDVVVLDDNVVHHYQLIAARYQALGGGRQTFRVFVPQEALPSLLTVQEGENAAEANGGAAASLRHLLISTDVTRIDLWVDAQPRLQRVLVPSAQLEAVRTK
jgi:hypothetical protein